MQILARPEVAHYTYRVAWSPEDGEFVATCLEFPSLEQVLAEVLTDMQAEGEASPVPFSERSYSGKFNVRVGEHLHRDLVTNAAEEGLSLNQYVLRKLSTG